MAKRNISHGYEHVAAEEQRREWERTKQELALTKRKLMESEELVLQLKTATRKLEETMRKRDKDLQRVFAVLRAPPDDQLTQTRKQELIERLVMDTQQRAVHAEALAEQRKKELDRLHFSNKFLRQRELEMELEECHLEIARLRAFLEQDRHSNQLHDAAAWAQRHSPKQQPTRSGSAESVRHTAPAHEPSSLRPTDRSQFTVHESVAPGVQILKPTTQKLKKESFVTKTRRRALEAEYFKQVRLVQLEAECELNENLHIRAAREAKAHRQAELLVQRQKQQAEQEERIVREREARLALELRQQAELEERVARERDERLALEHQQQVEAAQAVAAIATPASAAELVVVVAETTRDEGKDAASPITLGTDPAPVVMPELNAAEESQADAVVIEESRSEERRHTAQGGIQVPAQTSSATDAGKPEESDPEHQKSEKSIPKDVSGDEDPEDEVSAVTANRKEPLAVDADEVDESMEIEHQEKAELVGKTAASLYEEDFKDEDDESSDSEHREAAGDVARTAPLYEDDEFEDNGPSNQQHETPRTDTVDTDPAATHNGVHPSEFTPEGPADDDTEESGVSPVASDVDDRADVSFQEGEAEHKQDFVVSIEPPPVAQVGNVELLQISDPPTNTADGHAGNTEHKQGFVVSIEPPPVAQVGNVELLQISDPPTEEAEKLDPDQGFVVDPWPGLSGATSRDGNVAPESDPVQGFLLPVEYSAAADVDSMATKEEPVERPYYEQTQQPAVAAERSTHGFQGLLDHVGGALDHALDVCEHLVETTGESIEQHVAAAGHSMTQSLQHTQEAAAHAIQRLWRRRQPREPLHALYQEPDEAEPPQTEPSSSPVDTARTATTDECYSGFSDADEDP